MRNVTGLLISLVVTLLLTSSVSASQNIKYPQIVFLSERTDGNEIYIMNADGSDVRQITSVAFDLGDVVDADVSPDGSEIAFVTLFAPGLQLVNTDGSDVRDLIPELASFGEPAWSPDGSRIAFSSMRDKNHEIYLANADGSDITRLTDNIAADRAPTWSPDGSKIAFESERDGLPNVFVMNADGTNAVQLTSGSAYSGQPAW